DLGGFQTAPPVDPRGYRKFDFPVPAAVRAYAFAQFLAALAGASWTFWQQDARLLAWAALPIVGSLLSLGWLLEARRWAIRLEAGRLALLAAAAAAVARGGALAIVLALLAVSAAWLAWAALRSGAQGAPASAPA